MNHFYKTMRNFNRFELKYMIDLKQAEEFKKVLQRYMTPDTYGNQDGCYTIANLYYDSPNFRCYWEKENGIKYRRKLRIRHYETGATLTDETPVFVEIKQRVDRVTQKRRSVLAYRDALHLCSDRQIPNHDPVDRDAIKEIFVYLWQYNLVPANIIRYQRQAFTGTVYDPGLRVTFDTDLSFQVAPLHLHEKRTTLPFIPADKVVMEIKVNERIPNWLTEMIAAKNLQLYRISKYCCSIEAAWDLPGMQSRNLISEPSQEVLSSAYSVPVFWNSLQHAEKNN